MPCGQHGIYAPFPRNSTSVPQGEPSCPPPFPPVGWGQPHTPQADTPHQGHTLGLDGTSGPTVLSHLESPADKGQSKERCILLMRVFEHLCPT